jgi:hypothetical protein
VIAALTPLITRLRRYTIGRFSRWPTQSLRFNAPRAGIAEASLSATVTRRLRSRTVTYRLGLGQRRLTFAGAGARTLSMTLPAVKRALLRRPGTRLRLELDLRFDDAAQRSWSARRVAYLNR